MYSPNIQRYIVGLIHSYDLITCEDRPNVIYNIRKVHLLEKQYVMDFSVYIHI